MKDLKFICLFIIILAGYMVPVSAHGVDVTNATAIVIADNSTGKLAKTVANEMGMNISVYKYNSEALVQDELEHALSNPYKKILAVSYQDTVEKFINEHPEVSNRIFVCDANESAIRQGLTKLNASGPSIDFVTPLFMGILIGLVFGLGIGAVWMKNKLNE